MLKVFLKIFFFYSFRVHFQRKKERFSNRQAVDSKHSLRVKTLGVGFQNICVFSFSFTFLQDNRFRAPEKKTPLINSA